MYKFRCFFIIWEKNIYNFYLKSFVGILHQKAESILKYYDTDSYDGIISSYTAYIFLTKYNEYGNKQV